MTARPEHRAAAGEHDTHPEALEMPENHFDQVVVTGSVDESRRASLRTRIVAVVIMPLFFIVTFSLCYLSALHDPKPHDMALTIAGPSATTEQVARALDDRAPGGFDVTRTTDPGSARKAVEDRTAVGAVLIDGDRVTTVVAGGGGRTAAVAVEQVGDRVATELGGTATVTDVAPLTKGDVSGTVLFFFVVACTVGAFMTLTVVAQAMPRARTRTAVGVGALASLLIPVISFAVISIFVGDYGRSFGEIAAAIGVGMVYTFAVAMLSLLFNMFLKNAAIFGQILFLIALNFPSGGGSSPASMLPAFWQFVHSGWFGSGAFEAIRSIVYFDGAQAGRWLLQVAIWAAAAPIVVVIAAIGRARRRPEDEEAAPAVAQDGGAVLAGAGV